MQALSRDWPGVSSEQPLANKVESPVVSVTPPTPIPEFATNGWFAEDGSEKFCPASLVDVILGAESVDLKKNATNAIRRGETVDTTTIIDMLTLRKIV